MVPVPCELGAKTMASVVIGELGAKSVLEFNKTDDLISPLTNSTTAPGSVETEITVGQHTPIERVAAASPEDAAASPEDAATPTPTVFAEASLPVPPSQEFCLATIAKMVAGLDTRDSGMLERLMLQGGTLQLTKDTLAMTEENLSGVCQQLGGARSMFDHVDNKRFESLPRRERQRLQDATKSSRLGLSILTTNPASPISCGRRSRRTLMNRRGSRT